MTLGESLETLWGRDANGGRVHLRSVPSYKLRIKALQMRGAGYCTVEEYLSAVAKGLLAAPPLFSGKKTAAPKKRPSLFLEACEQVLRMRKENVSDTVRRLRPPQQAIMDLSSASDFIALGDTEGGAE